VINTTTMTVERNLDRTNIRRVVPSPDGQYLALLAGSLHLVRADDYSVVAVYPTPTEPWDAEFSGDGKMLYFKGYSDTLQRVSMAEPTTVRKAHVLGSFAGRLAVSHDGSLALLYYDQLAVYNSLLDSVVFREAVPKGTGEVELSRDGRTAFVSSPGYMEGTRADYSWKVFDVEQNAFVDSISVVTDCNYSGFERIGEFEMTPDGRKMVGIEGIVGFDPQGWDIVVYDLSADTVEFVQCLEQNRVSLGCQSQT
jgi:hypothetical protein